MHVELHNDIFRELLQRKAELQKFCTLTLTSVANATKICCVQKIKELPGSKGKHAK